MSAFSEFFLNSDSSVVPLETLDITHPSFSKRYLIVRNAVDGIAATLEDTTSQDFIYYPLAIKQTGASNDLDQKLQIQLGDLGEVVPQEIDNVLTAGTFATKPTLVYRSFRSDDLTAPMDGPYRFEITSIATTKDAASFAAEAPSLNSARTGEIYSIDRFPMLAAFV